MISVYVLIMRKFLQALLELVQRVLRLVEGWRECKILRYTPANQLSTKWHVATYGNGHSIVIQEITNATVFQVEVYGIKLCVKETLRGRHRVLQFTPLWQPGKQLLHPLKPFLSCC